MILAAAAMIVRRVRYTCADFRSNCHIGPYGSCNSAHFDDHQLHDVLQRAGSQLSNSLSYPRNVVSNHDIERHRKYSMFVKIALALISLIRPYARRFRHRDS